MEVTFKINECSQLFRIFDATAQSVVAGITAFIQSKGNIFEFIVKFAIKDIKIWYKHLNDNKVCKPCYLWLKTFFIKYAMYAKIDFYI